MTLLTRLAAYGVAVVAVFWSVWLGLRWIDGMQEQITTLTLERQDAEARAASAVAQLDGLNTRLLAEHDLRVSAEANIAVARQRAADQINVFNRHRFGELLKAKPGLIEKRMNEATAALWAQIEAESRE